MRIISFKNRDHHTDPLFKELEILPLDKSIELKNAKFMWRLKNGFLPESLANNFRNNERTNVTNSISRLESLKRFILFAGPKLWNELPSRITNKPSLNSFSNSLKKYIIHVAFYQDQRSETKDGELTTNFSFMSRVPSV